MDQNFLDSLVVVVDCCSLLASNVGVILIYIKIPSYLRFFRELKSKSKNLKTVVSATRGIFSHNMVLFCFELWFITLIYHFTRLNIVGHMLAQVVGIRVEETGMKKLEGQIPK